MGRFIELNRKWCQWIEERLPADFTRSFNRLYESTVSEAMRRNSTDIVLDVGGGKYCFISEFRDPKQNTLIISIDISEEELSKNLVVDARIVGDVLKTLPFSENSIDIITSRSVFEHLSDTRKFIQESSAILKPGGYFIHLFPGKFAPFALLNQILPTWLARKILYYFHPTFVDDCGFKAYYNGTYYSQVKKNLQDAGFRSIEIDTRYYQSLYFNFSILTYVISLSYDYLNYIVGVKNAASQILVIAKK